MLEFFCGFHDPDPSVSLPLLAPVSPPVHLTLSSVFSNFCLLVWSHHHQLVCVGGPKDLMCHFSICYSPAQTWCSQPFLFWIPLFYAILSISHLLSQQLSNPISSFGSVFLPRSLTSLVWCHSGELSSHTLIWDFCHLLLDMTSRNFSDSFSFFHKGITTHMYFLCCESKTCNDKRKKSESKY